MLVHQQPDNIWRIDYQLRDDEDEEEALREENIRAAVQKVLDECGYDAPWELEWWSVYSANTLLLDGYRHGRTIFMGIRRISCRSSACAASITGCWTG